MQKRHKNRKKYFEEQSFTTQKYVIPFILPFLDISQQTSVLEIGCGEGGNLKPFLDLGCKCTGIDINSKQIQNARIFFEYHPYQSRLELINEDIYNMNEINEHYDFIMLRDVIEHIPDQEKFMQFVKKFLKKNGIIFFGFPPWYNPFGGHQQVLPGIASKIPYVHILPLPIYKWYLKILRHTNENIKMMEEVHETGISIERFKRIIDKENYKVLTKVDYFINPNYEVKFGLKPKKVIFPFKNIPFFRNFYTTAVYFIVTLNENID